MRGQSLRKMVLKRKPHKNSEVESVILKQGEFLKTLTESEVKINQDLKCG